MKKINAKSMNFLKFFAFSIIILQLIIGCVSAWIVNNNANRVINNIIETNQDLLQSINTQVDNNFEQYINQMEHTDIREQLYRILQKTNDRINVKFKLALRSELEDFMYSNTGINAVGFIDNMGICTSTGISEEKIKDIHNYFINKENASSGSMLIYLIEDDLGSNLYIFKRMYYVDNLYEIHFLGDIILQMNSAQVLGKSLTFTKNDSTVFYTCDSDNNIIYSNQAEHIGKNFNEVYTYNNNDTVQLGNKSFIYLEKKSEKYCITNLALISKNETSSILHWSTVYIILLLLISTAVIGTIIIFFTSLNMRERKNYLLELKIKEVQISALESQINPHFLYNSLQMIQMMGVSQNYDGVQEATIDLAEVLRYSLEPKKEVLISTEIENVKYYLSLVKLRYRERFSCVFDIDEDIKNCKMLKFILQPVIENAIKHGVENVERVCEVKVLAKKFDGQIVLIVRDNGIGIEKERLEKIQAMLNGEAEFNNMGIGLKNVNERLKLYYGPEYGLEIVSQYNVKTDVMINIPIDKAEDYEGQGLDV